MTAQYFIEKFEAIPEEKWTVGEYEDGGRCCALGHCGVRAGHPLTPEEDALTMLFLKADAENTLIVSRVNDGFDPRYPQPTPKQRILAALRDIAAKEANL